MYIPLGLLWLLSLLPFLLSSLLPIFSLLSSVLCLGFVLHLVVFLVVENGVLRELGEVEVLQEVVCA